MPSESNRRCQQFRERVGSVADLTVPAGQAASHLRSCPDCQVWFAQMEEVVHELGAAPPPVLPDGFHQRLAKRLHTVAASDEALVGTTADPGPLGKMGAWLRYRSSRPVFVGASACALVAVALLLVLRTDRGVSREDHGVLVELEILDVERGADVRVEVQLPEQLGLASRDDEIRRADTLRMDKNRI